MLARGQPFACVSRHGDLVTSLTLSCADDHLENERILLGSPANLDHVDLLGMHVPALAGGCSVRYDDRVGRASASRRSFSAAALQTLALARGQIHACLSNIHSSRS